MTFDHYLFSSFKEYLDRKVTEKLAAWRTATIPLFAQNDNRKKEYKIVGAGPKQWVFDSGITSDIVKNNGLNGDWANAKVDYRNARLIIPKNGIGTAPASIVGSYKLFNSYISTSSDEDLFLNTNWDEAPEIISPNNSSKPYSYHAPCYFIKLGATYNRGLELGGRDKTTYDIKVPVFCKSEGDLYAIAGVFRDLQNTVAYVLDSTPLDEFNDLKEEGWTFYDKMAEMKELGSPKIYIEKVLFTPIQGVAIKQDFPQAAIGIATFTIFVGRMSH